MHSATFNCKQGYVGICINSICSTLLLIPKGLIGHQPAEWWFNKEHGLDQIIPLFLNFQMASTSPSLQSQFVPCRAFALTVPFVLCMYLQDSLPHVTQLSLCITTSKKFSLIVWLQMVATYSDLLFFGALPIVYWSCVPWTPPDYKILEGVMFFYLLLYHQTHTFDDQLIFNERMNEISK